MKTVAALLVAVLGLGALVVTTEPTWYLRMRYPLEYSEIVRGHARNYDLQPELLAAVIYTESKFDANAESDSGAIGLMQLLPATAQGIAARTGGSRFSTEDLYDPELNVRYGSWYLRHLLDKYDGDLRKALAAYNGGQGNVDRGIQYDETRAYVERVRELSRIYRRAYGRELRAAS
ncbi:MAG TPA: lytic transglycosylase domain-containing protein [Gaiellaceae bacterium]|nr:lytic transglycosylase domain-containing protein [Gaiellaceae bacterium]